CTERGKFPSQSFGGSTEFEKFMNDRKNQNFDTHDGMLWMTVYNYIAQFVTQFTVAKFPEAPLNLGDTIATGGNERDGSRVPPLKLILRSREKGLAVFDAQVETKGAPPGVQPSSKGSFVT